MTTAAPAPAASIPSAAPVKLTGAAAWAKVIGNTFSGKSDGEEEFEFVTPDGKLKSLSGTTVETGKWRMDGERVCLSYPSDDENCFTVEVFEDNVTFLDKSGSGDRWKILPGNPKGL